ncbi:MAG TPA: hypothetical protein VG206_06785 [Terriglobia bacterium]|nr:hypothetical protein [Terriglobia bacterium]
MRLVSRRRLLGCAAAVPLALHTRLNGLAAAGSQVRERILDHCLLVDAGEQCVLPESLAGFARALAAASVPHRRIGPDVIESGDFILVPGAVLHSSVFADTLSRLARRGSVVVYESGAAYAGLEAFRIEQHLLRTYFGAIIEAPMDLWPGAPSGAAILAAAQGGERRNGPPAATLPYVHYDWPSTTIVRDFSRAIPLSYAAMGFSREAHRPVESAHEPYHRPIARINDVPVCCRLRLGDGQFVFLGSPLGPHLASGDREAQALLQSLLSRS